MKTIDPLEHIRTHPEMYLPESHPEPARLAERLAIDSLLLGASRTETARRGRWWVVAADADWLRAQTDLPVTELFQRVVAFAKAGVNSMRSEVLLGVFAEGVVTAGADGRHVIKGHVPEEDEVWDCLTDSRWRRVVAFRL